MSSPRENVQFLLNSHFSFLHVCFQLCINIEKKQKETRIISFHLTMIKCEYQLDPFQNRTKKWSKSRISNPKQLKMVIKK